MAEPSCPICKRPVTPGATGAFPFCSKRCKLVDLGNWVDGRYVVTGPSLFDEAELEPTGDGASPAAGEPEPDR